MSRTFLLVLTVALAALVFAPVAAAQTEDRGMDEVRMEDRGVNDDNMMATPTATASTMSTASASTMSTASASASTSSTATATAKGGKSKSSGHLPRTGGMPLAPLLAVGALSLLMGSGLLAAGLVRRRV